MATIVLTETDNRLGRYAPDGSFASWPTVNLDGGRYVRENGIVLRVTGEYFVILPPYWDTPVEVKVGNLAQMMTEPPGEPSTPRKARGG